MKRKRVVEMIFLLLICCLLAVGCSESPEGNDSEGASGAEGNSPYAVVTTDMKGRDIKLENPVERIVVLTAADCEIIYALGAGDKVVGRGFYCDYPKAALDVIPVQSGRESNVEQIIALNPNVVFMGTMDQTEEQIAALEAAGTTVVMSDASDIEGVYRSIEMIGAVLDKEQEASELVEQMRASLSSIAEKAAEKSQGAERTIYFEVSPLEWGLWAAGSDTFMDEIASMLGLRNIFADISGWSEISQEQIISRNPDFIITVTMYFDDGPRPEDEILSRNGWQTIAAVQNGRVYLADSDELSRPGPRLVKAAETLYGLVYEE